MGSEIELYAQELSWLLKQMSKTLEGLTERQLRWHPALETTNSAGGIINHITRCTGVYVLGFGCGLPISRERATEFAVMDVSVASHIAACLHLADEIQTALVGLPPEILDERLLPTKELWGETATVREITRREAFILSIRHAALHLGELRLTSDLARRHA